MCRTAGGCTTTSWRRSGMTEAQVPAGLAAYRHAAPSAPAATSAATAPAADGASDRAASPSTPVVPPAGIVERGPEHDEIDIEISTVYALAFLPDGATLPI